MGAPHHRQFNDRLYGQFARLGKALASPQRLELLDLLTQSERTVESLAAEIGSSTANTSQHLQALRRASLVETRKDGLFVYYRLADARVVQLCAALRKSRNGNTLNWIDWFAITSAIGRILSPCRWMNCSGAPGRATS